MENKLAKGSKGIFLGKPGAYALVHGLRIEWKQFLALYPDHILVIDQKPDKQETILSTKVKSEKAKKSNEDSKLVNNSDQK